MSNTQFLVLMLVIFGALFVYGLRLRRDAVASDHPLARVHRLRSWGMIVLGALFGSAALLNLVLEFLR